MSTPLPFQISRITAETSELMLGLNAMFAEAFGDAKTYSSAPPGRDYFLRLLNDQTFIPLIAAQGDVIVGGLVAYELKKFEQERSEIYIYDLAVAEPFRRNHIATALIAELQAIAKERNAYVIFVQADHGDVPAVSLYSTLGVREDVHHFDIKPRARS